MLRLHEMENQESGVSLCYSTCGAVVEGVLAESRVTKNGSVSSWPLDKPIACSRYPSTTASNSVYAIWSCSCNTKLVNIVAEIILDAMLIIAQVILQHKLIGRVSYVPLFDIALTKRAYQIVSSLV